MVIGICRIRLLLHDNRSLKGKRQVIKSLVGKVRNRFNVSISEVDENDSWGTSVIGVSAVGNDRAFVNSVLDKTLNFIEGQHLAEVGGHDIEIINV